MSDSKPNRGENKSPTSFSLDKDLRYALKNAAARRSVSQSEAVSDAIRKWLALDDAEANKSITNSGIKEPPEKSTANLRGIKHIPAEIPDMLSSSERESVDLLLVILRQGSETVKKAIVWNLQGFAEPILAKGARHGNDSAGGDSRSFSEKIDDLIQSAEAVGQDEDARREWLEDLRQLKEKFGGVRGKSAGHGTVHRKRRG